MVIRHKIKKDEKLSQFSGSTRRGKKQQQPTRITRWAEPRLKTRKVKGNIYYYYCRGIDPEIYLGTADSILRAVLLVNKLPAKAPDNFETDPEYII